MKPKKNDALRTSVFSVISNILLAIIKFTAGILGNSFALIADAIESTADIFSSTLVAFGLRYSQKPADKNHPYGHGKIEPLITFIVVVFLVTSAVLIIVKGIKNISGPKETPKAWTLIVLALVVIWKEAVYRYVMAKSKKNKSTSLKAEAWHNRSDAITSIAAFIGISIAVIFGEGYESADDWAAIFAGLFIFYNSYRIFRPALGEILDENVHHDLISQIREYSLEVDGVIDTEKCFVRKSGMNYFVDLHAIVDSEITVREGHKIAHKLVDYLKYKIPEIDKVIVHVEPCE